MTEISEHGGQTQRMRAAISPVLEIGPDFIAGRLAAEDMAHTMVRVVQEFARDEEARRRDAATMDAPAAASAGQYAPEVHAVLAELYTCGSGYLADRCDSDCVVRTMAQIMGEFGDLAPAPRTTGGSR